MLAHLGVAVFVVGVTLVNGYQDEKRRAHGAGRHASTIGGYTLPLRRRARSARARTTAPRAARSKSAEDGAHAGHAASGEAHLHSSAHADDRGRHRPRLHARRVCLARRAARTATAWSVRVYYKPFVDWIWGGCLLMALGGLLAALDRRYRAQARGRAEPAPAGDAAPALTRSRHAMKRYPAAAVRRRWSWLPGRRPEPQPARGALAADRQAGAGLHAAAAGRARQAASARRT